MRVTPAERHKHDYSVNTNILRHFMRKTGKYLTFRRTTRYFLRLTFELITLHPLLSLIGKPIQPTINVSVSSQKLLSLLRNQSSFIQVHPLHQSIFPAVYLLIYPSQLRSSTLYPNYIKKKKNVKQHQRIRRKYTLRKILHRLQCARYQWPVQA